MPILNYRYLAPRSWVSGRSNLSRLIGFFIKRTVYQEIDDLKEKKQDKPFCTQQKALCDIESASMCEATQEIKMDLKEGRKEFKSINQKMDRLMGSMKLRFDDLNGE